MYYVYYTHYTHNTHIVSNLGYLWAKIKKNPCQYTDNTHIHLIQIIHIINTPVGKHASKPFNHARSQLF